MKVPCIITGKKDISIPRTALGSPAIALAGLVNRHFADAHPATTEATVPPHLATHLKEDAARSNTYYIYLATSTNERARRCGGV